jgi:hypothetical protein
MVQLTASIEVVTKELGLEDQVAKILQEEIDWEVLASCFVKSGWTMIDLPRFKDRYEAIDIELWIDENCKGKHMHRGKTYVFEKKEDAEWFLLRWA